jgi:hypothetical protein
MQKKLTWVLFGFASLAITLYLFLYLHVHYMPRKAGDDSKLVLFFRLFAMNGTRPIREAEMRQAVETMRAAIEK